MDADTRQQACDAFNLMQKNGTISRHALYTFIEDAGRESVIARFREYVDIPLFYKANKDYIVLWIPAPPDAGPNANPFREAVMIEIREFLAEGWRHRVGKSLLQ